MRLTRDQLEADGRTLPRLPQGEQPTLENCLREPIRTPGAVQPHGVLLVVDASGDIVRASENAGELLGRSARELLGEPLGSVLRLAHGAVGNAEDPTSVAVASQPLLAWGGPDDVPVEVIEHDVGGLRILELERSDPARQPEFFAFHASLRRAVGGLQEAGSVQERCELAARVVRALTGFDRVWVYRFAEDGHGEVVAEERHAETESFLGLHYPETDIPPLARALFLETWLRLIADTHASPVALIGDAGAAPLDMGRAVLRAVSPVHLQYLRTMGVRASMSISLIVDGHLWGLISCHHYHEPLQLAYQVRAAAELIGIVASTQIAAAEAREESELALELERRQNRVLAHVVDGTLIAGGLAESGDDLLGVCRATGAAVVIGREIHLVGATPSSADIDAILERLAVRPEGEVIATDCLDDVFPDLAERDGLAEVASGLVAAPFSRTQGSYLLWFRGELLRTVTWGEKRAPQRIDPSALAPLTPQHSFAAWAQTVERHSTPWRPSEIAAAVSLRSAIGGLLLLRTEQLARLNADLVRANQELAALADENAALYRREHTIADILQRSLLPAELPTTPAFEFAAAYEPSGEGIEVGGDFYDVFDTPEGVAAVVGDVCGKGPLAARLTALSRNTVRALATLGGARRPAAVLASLNDGVVAQTGLGEYLTAIYVVLAPQASGSALATLANGGHPPALVVRAGGRVEALEVRGTIIGAIPQVQFAELQVELAAGDALVLVTDGLTESRDPSGSLFGEQRLRAALEQAAAEGFDAASLLARLREALAAFNAGSEPRDDLVILVSRYVGSPAPERSERPARASTTAGR